MFGDANKSEIVWQSFDYPTDTWLPGMRFGGQQKIVSWKESFDPAPGVFSFHADSKQFVLTWNNSEQYWTSGNWDGTIFLQVPELTCKSWGLFDVSVKDTNSGLYVTFTYRNIKNGLSRYVVDKSGGIQQVSLFTDGNSWNMFWSQLMAQCKVYGVCSAYGICNSNNVQFCSCADGFTPADIRAWDSRDSWSSSCVRQSPLNCDPKNGSTDGFLEPSVTLPDADSASSYPHATTRKDCEKACLLNCSCTAYTFQSPSGPCEIWSGDLFNMHRTEPKSI